MLAPRSVEVKGTIDIPLPKPRPKEVVAEAHPVAAPSTRHEP